jgi:hypothetical protein
MANPYQILKIIDDRFYEGVLESELLCQVVLDWEEYSDKTGYTADELKGYVMKDMVIELLRMLNVKSYQCRAIGLS